MLDELLGSAYGKNVVAQVEKQVAELTKNMNFADAIDGKCAQYVTHKQLARSMRVMEAAFRSDKIGAPVQFEDIETEQREF